MTSPMDRALSMAKRALGYVSPNPAVGAVVVNGGRMVGEGSTQPPGGDHAEVVALRQAGPLATGSTLYVTLEPCAHHGRTLPCTDAIIQSGVAEVRAAMLDPNPRVNGRGIAALEEAEIPVIVGEGRDQAGEIIEAFAKHITTGRPFVVAKFAMSLDGKIAAHTGDSRWVTGPEARARVHELRFTYDAIMVGIGTVLADDPQLTARDADGDPMARQPLRVVVDSAGQTPPASRMLEEPGETVVATASDTEGVGGALAKAGASVVSLPADGGQVDLDALLKYLGEREVTGVLVEGGGVLLGSLFDRYLVDKVHAFIAPKIVGGASAPGPVGGEGVARMAEALTLKQARWERLGDDLLVTGYTSN